MRVVVADAGPIRYLVLIGHVEILAALFGKIIIPEEVRDELAYTTAPETVRRWLEQAPQWLEVRTSSGLPATGELEDLDEGERSALLLAESVGADLVLLDDRAGVRAARRRGLAVAGTLRVLQLAARQGLLSLPDAFERLKSTNFRYRQELLDELLRESQGGTA